MTGLLEQALHGFNVFTLGYFVVLQLIYTVLAIVGWRAIEDYVKRRPMRDYQAVAESEMSMPVSILVPAYNEAPSIVASLRSLLHLAVRRVRDRRDQRRLDRRDDGGADRGVRSRQGRPRAALQHPHAAGSRRVHEPARAARRRHRQGQRRQGRRAERRHQPRGLSALLRDRRRHDARRRRPLPPRLGVPGRAGDGRCRRHRAHRQRIDVRGRAPAQGAYAAATCSRTCRSSSTCAPSSAAASAGRRAACC